MAFRAPVYKQRVSLAGIGGYRQNLRDEVSAAQGEAAEGFSRLAHGADRLAQKVREEQDAAAIEEAYAELTRTRQSLLDDPNNGLVTRKGKAALAERESFVTYYDAQAKRLIEGLGPRARARFQHILTRDRDNYVSSVDRHVARESEALAEQAHVGALQAAQSDAVGAASRGELDKSADAIASGLGAIDLRATAQGWAGEYAEAQRREFATNAHMAVLGSMLNSGRTTDAREYLAKARADMDEAALAKSNIEKLIAAAGREDEARLLADQAWKESGGDPLKAAGWLRDKGIKDTALFDMARERVRGRAAEGAALEREANAPVLADLELDYRAGKGFGLKGKKYERLTPEGQKDWHRFVAAEQRSKANDPRQDEFNRYLLAKFDALDLAGSDGKDQVSVDLSTGVWRHADATTAEKLIARQKEADRSVKKDQGVAYSEFITKLDDRLNGMRLTKKERASLKTHASRRFRGYRDPKNPSLPPPPEMVDEWIEKWFTEGEATREDWWFDKDRTAIEAEMEGATFTPSGQPAAKPAARPVNVPSDWLRYTNGTDFRWAPPGPAPAGWRQVRE